MEYRSVASDWRKAQADLAASRAKLCENRAVLRSHVERLRLSRGGVVDLRESVIARLRARLESQPVIEQAKGILIARSGCSPDRAFEVLRQASQRTNTKVRDIAARIVADAQNNTDSRLPARGIPSSWATPRSIAASWSRNPGSYEPEQQTSSNGRKTPSAAVATPPKGFAGMVNLPNGDVQARPTRPFLPTERSGTKRRSD